MVGDSDKGPTGVPGRLLAGWALISGLLRGSGLSMARKVLTFRLFCRDKSPVSWFFGLLEFLYREIGALLEAVEADDEVARLRICLWEREEQSKKVPFLMFASRLPRERLLKRSATSSRDLSIGDFFLCFDVGLV
jgi:hypothetical protein